MHEKCFQHGLSEQSIAGALWQQAMGFLLAARRGKLRQEAEPLAISAVASALLLQGTVELDAIAFATAAQVSVCHRWRSVVGLKHLKEASKIQRSCWA